MISDISPPVSTGGLVFTERFFMKIAGVRPGKNEDFVVFSRPDGNIVFKLVPVVSFEHFMATHPVPQPKKELIPGKGMVANFNDPSYKAAITFRDEQLTHYIVLETVKHTDGLEWERVNMAEPATWKNWSDELIEANMLQQEVLYLINKVMDINALNESKMEAARDSFLAERQALSN